MTLMFKIGDPIKLTMDIYDDGEDHHPPCFLAFKNDIVYIKSINGNNLGVSHEGCFEYFIIKEGEYITLV